MNILLKISFKGNAYHGFQVQPGGLPTICGSLQAALQAVLAGRPDVKGCSRTDAGVHALEYCLSFKCETAIPMGKLPLALNAHLPSDIRVSCAQQVPENFHARYSAQGKEYCYHILNSATDDPFKQGLYYRVAAPLNVAHMQKAAQHFVGTHNFASFVSAGASPKARPPACGELCHGALASPAAPGPPTQRSIHHFTLRRSGSMLYLCVAADGFLYNMVRILAGTLLQVGRGQVLHRDIPAIITACSRTAAGPTLPAKGLFLNKVFYSDESLQMNTCF